MHGHSSSTGIKQPPKHSDKHATRKAHHVFEQPISPHRSHQEAEILNSEIPSKYRSSRLIHLHTAKKWFTKILSYVSIKEYTSWGGKNNRKILVHDRENGLLIGINEG
jgi:hypothetical protein